MKTGMIIFNGLQFHDYHVAHAIDWAEKNKAELVGVFIRSGKEPPEGYIFPSDIDPAEKLFNKKDAEKANVSVIHTQEKLLTDMAKEKNVTVTIEEFIDPSLKEVIKLTIGRSILFVDADYKKSFILAANDFSFADLIEEANCPVELVYD